MPHNAQIKCARAQWEVARTSKAVEGLGKGWCDEFETALNIIIAIVQKV